MASSAYGAAKGDFQDAQAPLYQRFGQKLVVAQLLDDPQFYDAVL
jgi:hypothetical protein